MSQPNHQNKPSVPLAKDAPITTAYVNHYIKTTFEYIFQNAEHTGSIEHGIIMGLSVKLKKLYDSSYRLADERDMLAFSIILRSLYEVSVSLRYILLYLEDDETVKKFIIGDAMSVVYNLNGALRNGKMEKDQYSVEIETLKKHLEQHSISLSDIPKGLPKSWHPTKNLRDLAKLLDATGEALAIYDTFYSGSSQLAHPSLMDIMRWHVTKKDEESPYIPNEHPMYVGVDGKVLVQCMCLVTLEILTASATEFSHLTNNVVLLHRKLHLTYNDEREPIVSYLASLQEYAKFWMQNYPDLGSQEPDRRVVDST